MAILEKRQWNDGCRFFLAFLMNSRRKKKGFEIFHYAHSGVGFVCVSICSFRSTQKKQSFFLIKIPWYNMPGRVIVSA